MKFGIYKDDYGSNFAKILNFGKVIISGSLNQPHRISPRINNRCNFYSTANIRNIV